MFCFGGRTARAVLEKGDNIATGKLVSGLLRAMTLNLWGLGATIVGLQVTHLLTCGRLKISEQARWLAVIETGCMHVAESESRMWLRETSWTSPRVSSCMILPPPAGGGSCRRQWGPWWQRR